jgi:hypothetical protein
LQELLQQCRLRRFEGDAKSRGRQGLRLLAKSLLHKIKKIPDIGIGIFRPASVSLPPHDPQFRSKIRNKTHHEDTP